MPARWDPMPGGWDPMQKWRSPLRLSHTRMNYPHVPNPESHEGGCVLRGGRRVPAKGLLWWGMLAG